MKTPICWLVAGAALLGAATPVLAHADEDVVITGRYHRVPGYVTTLSMPVYYGDLNLNTRRGWQTLTYRVSNASWYMCNRLGEPEESSVGVVKSCRVEATRDAMKRVGTQRAAYAPRGTHWVRGPASRRDYAYR